MLRERLELTGSKKGCSPAMRTTHRLAWLNVPAPSWMRAPGNAVFHATGRRIRDPPITAAKLLA